MKNYYDVLNIKKNISNYEIKKAYKEMASRFHPDKYPENTKFAEDMMKNINVAYSVLSDIAKRRAYDEWLDSESGNTKTNGNTESKNTTDFQNNIEKTENDRLLITVGLLIMIILIFLDYSVKNI